MADDSSDSPTDEATDTSIDEVTDAATEATASTPDEKVEEKASAPSTRKADADAAVAARKVERRVVTSRRVTPKGGVKVEPSTGTSKARDAKKTEAVVTRTPPAIEQTYSKGPSPWWVPALMFGLLILGGLLIMANYMGVFGDPDNIRLVAGLGLILGGIITATQYR